MTKQKRKLLTNISLLLLVIFSGIVAVYIHGLPYPFLIPVLSVVLILLLEPWTRP